MTNFREVWFGPLASTCQSYQSSSYRPIVIMKTQTQKSESKEQKRHKLLWMVFPVGWKKQSLLFRSALVQQPICTKTQFDFKIQVQVPNSNYRAHFNIPYVAHIVKALLEIYTEFLDDIEPWKGRTNCLICFMRKFKHNK